MLNRVSLLTAGLLASLVLSSGAEARKITVEVHDMVSAARIEAYQDQLGDQIIRFRQPTYAGLPLVAVENDRERDTIFCQKSGYKFAGVVFNEPNNSEVTIYDLKMDLVRTSFTTVAEINCRK